MNGKFSMAVFLVLLFSPLHAQENTSWETLAKSLKAGKRISVTQMNLSSFQGKLVTISDDSLTVEAEGHQTKTVQRSEIVRVSLAGQRARNALIGLGIGVAAGAGIGLAIQGNPDVSSATAAAIVGVVGGLGGLGAGAALPANRVLYRAPRQP